jgi:hypothetical protein
VLLAPAEAAVVVDVDEVVDGDEVVVEVELVDVADFFAGGSEIAKSEPVTTTTSAPRGVGAYAVMTAPVNDRATRSASASTAGE